jgi:hypothetical protein
MGELVCAWCGVNCREQRNMRDEDGRVIQSWTVCAYCGRTELIFRKQGGQKPNDLRVVRYSS